MTSMEVPFAVLADSANIAEGGKLNILGIFDRISAPNFPTLHPHMQLVVSFVAEQVEVGQQKPVEIRLTDADGTAMGSITGTLVVPPPRERGYPIRINQIFPLSGLVFMRPGDYQFNILVNNEPKRQVSFAVVPIQQN